MLLATQYYRPPFPNRRWWGEDLDAIQAAGLNGIQLWACWGWIEPEPGKFIFDDYDELVEGARRRGLFVVLSTVGEIMPFWVPRVFPEAAMVDHMGRRVISSLRQECNVGLTPGGCTDHKGLREAMVKFLGVIAARYASADNLVGWDCWNELRWMVNSDGYVCYCENTLSAYRAFLQRMYGHLEGLNQAWQRRYASWEDVFPPKHPGGQGHPIPLYTDTLAWQRFLVWRAADTCRWRYEAIRKGDPTHPILAHCAAPTAMPKGRSFEPPTARGNDWCNADQLDGYGSSHFPNWGGGEFTDEDIGVRIECVRSAAGDKPHWLSELQGGQSNIGLIFGPPVSGAQQQRWVWNGYSRGAKAVIFWCWRDEVFAAESSGFGIVGDDGYAEDRLKYMRCTGQILSRYAQVLDNYVPDPAPVGLLFISETPMIDWSIHGQATQMSSAFLHYARALEKLGIPYEILDADHLERLDRVKLVIMPEPVVVSPETERRLLDFVAVGGNVFAEAWTQAWDTDGFFRYTGKARPFIAAFHLEERCRKHVTGDGWSDAWSVTIPARWAVTPWKLNGGSKGFRGEILGTDSDGEPLLVKVGHGAGTGYFLGTWAAHGEEASPHLPALVAALCRDAGALPEVQVKVSDGAGHLLWRTGMAKAGRLFFLINGLADAGRQVEVTMPASYLGDNATGDLSAEDLWSGVTIPVEKSGDRARLTIEVPPGGIAILLIRT